MANDTAEPKRCSRDGCPGTNRLAQTIRVDGRAGSTSIYECPTCAAEQQIADPKGEQP